MGPEIWKNRPYSYTSDTWAVGCLLYELAALQVPFEARSMSELRYKVLRGAYPPVPGTFSRDLQQMVRECLDPNPDKRPSMDQVSGVPSAGGIRGASSETPNACTPPSDALYRADLPGLCSPPCPSHRSCRTRPWCPA